MLSLLADGEEKFVHHWKGNPQSTSVSKADAFFPSTILHCAKPLVLSAGRVFSGESFHIGN